MVQNPQVSGDDFILEDRSGRDVDPVAGVCNDDDGAAEGHATPEHDVAGDCQVIQLQDVWNWSESLQEFVDLQNI